MLMPGAWVEVLSPGEIAATLDAEGTVEALPFMPEMLSACGRRFRVSARAERACVRGVAAPATSALRQLDRCVVLEGLRCDGSAHGGCQLGCTLLWKESWLRAVDAPGPEREASNPAGPPPPLRTTAPRDPLRFVCQGTELARATHPGPPRWAPSQYVRLVRVGTLTPTELASTFARAVAHRFERVLRRLVPLRAPADTADSALGLQPGEWAQVKSKAEILRTLDASGRHRGLSFSADMYGYCGQTLRVRERIGVILQEETGRARTISDTVALEGADCRRHFGCARQMPLMWREAWLRRVAAAPNGTPGRSAGSRGYRAAKRALDASAAAVGLVTLSPLLLAIAAAVRLSSPGPVLFRQVRVGARHRPFTLLKFRSMVHGSSGAAVTARGDARVTRVGRALRRTKLDELPQLWNVLVGDMSLVGPRPEVPEYVSLFPAAYARILTVRPGLTDFAALEFRDEEIVLAASPDPEAAYRQVVLPAKIALYERYLGEMSFGTDLVLLLRTLAAVVR